MIISLKSNFKPHGLPFLFSDPHRLGKATYDKLVAGESVEVDSIAPDVKAYLDISEKPKPKKKSKKK